MVPDLAGHSSFFPSSWYRTKIPGKRNPTVVELGRSPVKKNGGRGSKTRDLVTSLDFLHQQKKYFSLVKNMSKQKLFTKNIQINSTGKRVSNDTVGTIYFPFFISPEKRDGWKTIFVLTWSHCRGHLNFRGYPSAAKQLHQMLPGLSKAMQHVVLPRGRNANGSVRKDDPTRRDENTEHV